MMCRLLAGAVLAMGSLLATSTPVLAQGALVQGSVAAAVSRGSTAPLFGGGIGYRFNGMLGIGVELSHVNDLSGDFARIYCCDPDEKIRLTTFTTNVRVEIPTTSGRVIPFVVGGGGVAAVTQTYHVLYALPFAESLSSTAAALGLTLPITPGPVEVRNTTTNMVLTLGGGASFLLNRHVSVDADLRVLRVLGNEDQSIGRFGGGLSYRF